MNTIVIVISLLTVFPAKVIEALTGVQYTWAPAGNSVTVRCPLHLSSCTGIAWHWLSESVAPVPIPSQSTGKYAYTNDCGLVINTVDQADAVYFRCTISGQSAGVYLFVIQSAPSCTVNPPNTSEDVAEGEVIQYECVATIYGIGLPQVTWFGKMNEAETEDKSTGYNIHGTLKTVAKAPKVQKMECYVSFLSKEKVVTGRACETKEYDIQYSVRNVRTSPELFVRLGEELTCSADSNPKASFIWMVKEKNGTEWLQASELNEKFVAKLRYGTSSAQYMCVAWNIVKAKAYTSVSPEIELSLTNHGSAIRTPIIMTVGIVALLVIDGIIFGKWSH